jgi:hypothetical protein
MDGIDGLCGHGVESICAHPTSEGIRMGRRVDDIRNGMPLAFRYEYRGPMLTAIQSSCTLCSQLAPSQAYTTALDDTSKTFRLRVYTKP